MAAPDSGPAAPADGNGVPTGAAPVNQFPKQQAESGEIGRDCVPLTGPPPVGCLAITSAVRTPLTPIRRAGAHVHAGSQRADDLGHVNEAPRLVEDSDVITICRFVLTRSTHAIDRHRPGWEQQHYNVIAYDKVAETFTHRHQPGQVIVITDELDLQIQDTLIGPLPAITIIAHSIVLVDGPLNPAASIAVPDPQHELAHTTIGPVPHTRAGW